MGQPAYDRNAVRRRRAPQPQRKANLRVAKGGNRKLGQRGLNPAAARRT